MATSNQTKRSVRVPVRALLEHLCDVDVLVEGLVLHGELRDLLHEVVYLRDRRVLVVPEGRVPVRVHV